MCLPMSHSVLLSVANFNQRSRTDKKCHPYTQSTDLIVVWVQLRSPLWLPFSTPPALWLWPVACGLWGMEDEAQREGQGQGTATCTCTWHSTGPLPVPVPCASRLQLQLQPLGFRVYPTDAEAVVGS